jgi:uncharacterized glyoxalase superfamily protein PhnB
MRRPPTGWPRISQAIFYDDADAAIDWLCEAFGFELRLKVEGDGGRIEHSELTFDDGLIMVGSSGAMPTRPDVPYRSPRSIGGANTQAMCIHVEDVDAHFRRATAAGARITRELATIDYGADYWADRSYEAEDPEGHRWFFMQRMRNPAE